MDKSRIKLTGAQEKKVKDIHVGEIEEEKKMLKKSKSGFFHVVFGRTGMLVIAMLVQLLFLFLVFEEFRPPIAYYWSFNIVIGIALSIFIINHEKFAEFQVTWLIFIWIVPFMGALFYIFTKTQLGHKLLNKTIGTNISQMEEYAVQSEEVIDRLKTADVKEASLAEYAFKQGSYPVFNDTEVTYYPLGEDQFKDLCIELKRAETFIFMEYFIIKEGYMWDTILDILKEKAQAGVEVRLMYDGTCTLVLLPNDYPKKMAQFGIQCKIFSNIRPFLTTTQNNRDHRKIVVIDGKTAFTGGINLADEYINRVARFGHWKDTGIMLKGEAVRTMTMLFLQLWNVKKPKDTDYRKYLDTYQGGAENPAITQTEYPSMSLQKGFVIPYGESPLDNELFGENIYLDILNRAERYVHIMTPYLIIDANTMQALTYAAKRGVEVSIILPHIPDKVYAFALAKSYYKQLITAGVKIYEYLPGFVHAKAFVSDDRRAVVSTINLDYRSLYLHFECGVYMYDAPVIRQIEEDMQSTMDVSMLISMTEYKKSNLLLRGAGKVLRVVAPLM